MQNCKCDPDNVCRCLPVGLVDPSSPYGTGDAPLGPATRKINEGDQFVLEDTGAREEFDTGARRDQRGGKGRFDLLSPIWIRRLALLLERGALKYGDRNWEKGMPVSRYLDSALRHIYDYMEGKREEDHLVQAAWNCLSAVHVIEMVERKRLPDNLDDAPSYLEEADTGPVGLEPHPDYASVLYPQDEDEFFETMECDQYHCKHFRPVNISKCSTCKEHCNFAVRTRG